MAKTKKLGEKKASASTNKKMDDWDFSTKYNMLAPELKLLHQVRLLRADLGTLVYIVIAFIPLYLSFKINPAFLFLMTAVLLYGFYRHIAIRDSLKTRFEHASTYIGRV
ncbi:MAG: hypothetical protein KC506_03265 [Nanoarchaeota archaeon]|nr:hypothetical protein [Nanoarchaeota archaeon]